MGALDTTAYDLLPISAFVYEPVCQEDGTLRDFRLVYANRAFAADWREVYHNDAFQGAMLRNSLLMDEHSLAMMERFQREKPHAFSTYMPMVRMHLHFTPMEDLPAPYHGFFVTNITDYEEREFKTHFLRTVSQMQNNAVLMRRRADGHLETVYVSEAFARMIECTVEQAKERMDGAGFFQTTSPEDRPFVRSILKRRVAVDGSSDLTIQMVTAEKNRIWCNVHYSFIDDFSETYIYCTYVNVTVLKRYEERLRSVYASLGNSFYQSDAKTLALFRVNLTRNTVEEAKGPDLYPTDTQPLSYAERMARRAEQYVIPQERDRLLRTFDRERLSEGYLEGRASAREVAFSRRPDGQECFVELAAALTRHPLSGDMIAFITERECNAEKVKDTLMRKILARQFDMVAYLVNGKYGVSIGDAANIAKGSIFPTSRSGEYRQYLEHRVRPVLSGTEEEREEAMEALSLERVEAQTQLREPYVVHISIETGGEVFHKRFDFYLVDPLARFYIVLKSDVTELMREQAERNQQLSSALSDARQANVAKTAFLSSMSHEIRTPMNAIIGLNSLALREPEISDRTRGHLEKIGGSARHLLGLINDILDMSRIESGRMVLKNEPFSIDEILEQVNTMIGGQCQERGLSYECHVEGKVCPFYLGDDLKLKQVLINILGNAVKFTPPPGFVRLHIRQMASFADQHTLRFTIQDTGIGMDKDYLPVVFDAFSQEDTTVTNRYGGSGLGMAITKNIVEMMNGTILVESEKGVGTTFTVELPLREAYGFLEPAPAEPPDTGGGAERAGLTGRRVLLAEDMPINAEIILELLELKEMRADHAENGKIAVELFSAHPVGYYDAILMDLRMPEMDGLTAAKAIRALSRPDAGTVPIIALTANAFEEDVQRSLQAGINAHLTKPVEPERLFATLSQFIRD